MHDGLPQEKEIQFYPSTDDLFQMHESTTKTNFLIFDVKKHDWIAFTRRFCRLRKNSKIYGIHCNFY